MATILSDKHCEGHAVAIFRALKRLGYVELLDLHFETFEDVGLADKAPDETVWLLCQEKGYLLLTGNRRTVDGEQSLELVTQRLATLQTLPVLTIGTLARVLYDNDYCERCAETIALIVIEPERFVGTPRLYIPLSE